MGDQRTRYAPAMPPVRPGRHLVALLVLVAHGLLLLAGTPGLAAWKAETFSSPKLRAKIASDFGEPTLTAVTALGDLNSRLRIPAANQLRPIERFFRISQSWHLYGEGPRFVRRLEVRVDGQLVYRSRDPDHAWRASMLENRHMRPLVERVVNKANASNWRGLGRFLIDCVSADFPEAQRLDISSTQAHYGSDDATFRHGRQAAAPDWALIPVDEGGQPIQPLDDETGPDPDEEEGR